MNWRGIRKSLMDADRLSRTTNLPSILIPHGRWLNYKIFVSKITDGTHKTPKYTDDGVPFLRVTDITKTNESKKFISREEHLELVRRCNPEKGDTLYSKKMEQ